MENFKFLADIPYFSRLGYFSLFTVGSYVCDCSMGSNLGVNCHHYYCTLTRVSGMVFHLASIRKRYDNTVMYCNIVLNNSCRWWQDPNIDAMSIESVTLTHSVPEQCLGLHAQPLDARHFANPLERQHNGPTPPPATQSINSHIVFHEAHAALKPLMNSVQTQEQLDKLLAHLNDIRYVHSS